MEAEERRYGAGEDIPGTPGPFPFGLVAFGFAFVSMLIAANWFFGDGSFIGWPFYGFACLAWLGFGVAGLIHGQWKGPVLGLPIIAAPWIAMFVLIVNAFSPE